MSVELTTWQVDVRRKWEWDTIRSFWEKYGGGWHIEKNLQKISIETSIFNQSPWNFISEYKMTQSTRESPNIQISKIQMAVGISKIERQLQIH